MSVMRKTTRLLVLPAVLAGIVCAQLPERIEQSQSIRDEQYRQMDRYITDLVMKADGVRAEYWKDLDLSSIPAYERSVERYRRDWSRFLGVPDMGNTPLSPRREKVAELETHTVYRVWLDCLPGVQAYGVLLVPKRLRGKAPGLVALHGHGGSAEIVAGLLDPKASGAYKRFGETAARRGYVVWCPFIFGTYSEEYEPQEGPEARGRNILNKKALIAGTTIMGVELAKLRRGVDYLESLPEVDARRIGMYGLSKGGHYTLYAAALDTRIQAAVVSGWFNHRTRKLLAPKTGNGMFWITYPNREEYYLRDLLTRFGDAELGWLTAPRAIMIENGSKDGAVLIHDAREEFERVVRVYRRLGIGDKARFAAFDGPHQIDGAESFPFLDQWLGNKAR
jgi:cephalosporin-C deacetylase-like acetyl esterase